MIKAEQNIQDQQYQPMSNIGQFLLISGIAVVVVLFAKLTLQTGVSADLLPAWIAAEFYYDQQWQLIYSSDVEYFTMMAPEQWNTRINSIHPSTNVYPFVYAPLWAALLAPLTQMTSYATFDWIVGAVNPVLLVLTPYFAWRAAPMLRLQIHMVLALLIVLTSSVGIIPLINNQFQIIVAFLSVLAVERYRNGHPITAGFVLALAAALKIYPAIFALLFLALRQRRAFIAFIVTGSAIGLLSVLLAGWPLHKIFLSQISAISNTVILINLSMGFDGLIGQAFFWDQAVTLSGDNSFLVLEKPGLWRWMSRVAILLLIIGLIVWGRWNQSVAKHPLYWPFAFICYTLLAPLSWSYYYLAPLAFAPLLIGYWGVFPGVVFLVFIKLSLSLTILKVVEYFPEFTLPLLTSGSVGLILLAIAMGLTILRTANADKNTRN